MVHNNGTHANQHIISHRAPMYNGVMTNRNIITNNCLCALKGAMNNCSVLNIHLIPYPDAVYISPYYCIEPDAAMIAGNNIPNNGRIGGNKTILSKLRIYPLYMHYSGHSLF